MEARLLSPALWTGVILEDFQSEGKRPLDRERLNSLCRDGDIEWAVFLSMWEDILSGPVNVLILRESKSFCTSSSEQRMVDSSGGGGEGGGWTGEVGAEKQLEKYKFNFR